ncbi:type III pantothenate kinase [Ekhidna sp. MALMAid0563]|uniref:type III pantothenate kinase n=1 Tax=Ekhidna sp. MALMAid0563 TaxID=3143937 RepID=UPI0032DE3504
MDEKIEVILIDVGNSSVKTTEVVNGEFINTRVWTEGLSSVLAHYRATPIMISSVRKLPEELELNDNITVLSHLIKLPIKLDYDTPETLGADRIAAAVGVMEKFPEENNLIIDLGTCMTIDLVEKGGIFKGGVIAPGLKMRMKSMAHFTDKLPDISSEWEHIMSGELGKSTKQCLFSGSYWGIIHEINGVLQTLRQDFTSLNTILTGGDAHFFESKLKAHIFAGSKIVQRGLYRIWKYQQ